MKDFAHTLGLKRRLQATRKWPIKALVFVIALFPFFKLALSAPKYHFSPMCTKRHQWNVRKNLWRTVDLALRVGTSQTGKEKWRTLGRSMGLYPKWPRTEKFVNSQMFRSIHATRIELNCGNMDHLWTQWDFPPSLHLFPYMVQNISLFTYNRFLAVFSKVAWVVSNEVVWATPNANHSGFVEESMKVTLTFSTT